MALTPCPECGREVSSSAPACIHCGFPLARSSPQHRDKPLDRSAVRAPYDDRAALAVSLVLLVSFAAVCIYVASQDQARARSNREANQNAKPRTDGKYVVVQGKAMFIEPLTGEIVGIPESDVAAALADGRVAATDIDLDRDSWARYYQRSADQYLQWAIIALLILVGIYLVGVVVLLGRGGLDRDMYQQGTGRFLPALFALLVWPLVVLFGKRRV